MSSLTLQLSQRQFDLGSYNSLALPCLADAGKTITDLSQIPSLLAQATDMQLPLCVIGGGSNVVLPPHWPAIVALNRLMGIQIINETLTHVTVRVASGVPWQEWVDHSLRNGWLGLENLTLIPGTVGAAPIQNIGAYGVEVANLISSVDYIDLKPMLPCPAMAQQIGDQQWRLPHHCCQFEYRNSIFKKELAGRTFITAVTFYLKKLLAAPYQPLLSYPELQQLKPTPTDPMSVANAIASIRKRKLPNPDLIPNAGSFFKNPQITAAHFYRLQQQYKNLNAHPVVNPQSSHLALNAAAMQYKLSAAWLIEACGLKGLRQGPVAVSDQHALVLIHDRSGDANDLLRLAHLVKQKVAQQFEIQLEIEPSVF